MRTREAQRGKKESMAERTWTLNTTIDIDWCGVEISRGLFNQGAVKREAGKGEIPLKPINKVRQINSSPPQI